MYADPRVMVALLSLLVGRGGCYPGEMMDRLPQTYLDQLQLLELALGLNVEWSAVWSEKLTVDTTYMPDPERCVPLIDSHGAVDATTTVQTVDPFDVVSLIVSKCSYSGMYVEYGVKMLSRSLRCYFYRNARVHVSAVQAHLSNLTPEFVELLRGLVNDYKLITDKLAAVNTSLDDVVQLATFFYDVAEMSSELAKPTPETEDLLDDLEKKTTKVVDVLNENFGAFCDTNVNDWFDDDKNEIVNLKPIKNKNKKKKDKKKKNKKNKDEKKKKMEEDEEDSKEEEGDKEEKKKKKDKGKAEDGEDDTEKNKKDVEDSISRINELRLIMQRVFNRLFITKMPALFWEDTFSNTILIKASAFQERDPDEPPKKPRKKLGLRF